MKASYETRKCRECGRPFLPNHVAQAYCSDRCRCTAHNRNRAEAMRKQRGSLPVGTPVTATCKRCGAEFTYPHRARARAYCDECMNEQGKMKRGPKPAAVYPPERRICLFCGRKFTTTRRADFCARCANDRFDQVYEFRKRQSGGNWLSDGDRARRRAAK